MAEAEVPIRPAATVMLLRDTPPGLEVFMLRRHSAMAFAGGVYVFPGGRVDDADGTGDEAFVVAAIRECYEEAGILLAVDADGGTVSDGHPALAHRVGVHDGTVDVRMLVAEHGLRLATDALPWVAHWITPKGETARRFDTRFFMVASPAGQTSHHDDTETVASMWVRPSAAITEHGAGDLQLLPPTIWCLRELARFNSVAEAMAWGRSVGTPDCVMPKLRYGTEGKVVGLALPWDEVYDSIEA
ncbi:MAG: NUDIX domain-containing protein [Actinomycetota bacterium]